MQEFEQQVDQQKEQYQARLLEHYEIDVHEFVSSSYPLVFPEHAKGISIWAKVSATDHFGVRISNVKAGDIVRIVSVSGLCSFSDKSFVAHFLSVFGIIGFVGTTADAAGLGSSAVSTIAQTVRNGSKALKPYEGKRGKIRTGYGETMSGSYARKEGGIIVCMPQAAGAIYATSRNYLRREAEKNGRLHEYVPVRNQGKCFFPYPDGVMEMTAADDGTVHILTFDKDHMDNEGTYDVEFTVIRGAEDTYETQDALRSCFAELHAS